MENRDLEEISIPRGALLPLFEMANIISETFYRMVRGEFNPRAGGTPPGTLEKMEQTAVELGATVMSLNAIFLNNGEPTIRWYAPGPVFRLTVEGMKEARPGVLHEVLAQVDELLAGTGLDPQERARVEHARVRIAEDIARDEAKGAARALAEQELDEGAALDEALSILGMKADEGISAD